MINENDPHQRQDDFAVNFGITPDEPYTIVLQHAVEWGSKTITTITIRPVTGGDLRKLKTGSDRPLAMVLELAGYLAGEVTQVIDRVRGADLGVLIHVTNFFLASSQGIGTAP